MPIFEKIPDVIIHLAGIVGRSCEKRLQEAWEINVTASQKVGLWANDCNVKLIFASTCSNYGISSTFVDESSSLNPLGAYAKTKVEAEKFILGLECDKIVLRFATLAGISPRPRFDTLLNEWVKDACTDGVVKCYNPLSFRPFVHLGDAATAIQRAIWGFHGYHQDLYNVISFNTTKGELARQIRKTTNCKVEESGDMDTRDYAVNYERIAKHFNFVPKYSLQQCIDELVLGVKWGIIWGDQIYTND